MSNLFVVPRQEVAQTPEPEEIENEPLVLSGDMAADLDNALRAIAFLVDFVNNVGADGLLDCADKVHAFRKEVGTHE
jgi:hypothetical protein